MTKKDYSKCKFYRLICRDPTIVEVYVGHTCNETKRRYQHKRDSTYPHRKNHNARVYQFIRNHGGFENWQLLVHEEKKCENKVDVGLRERFWVEHYGATLNKNVPSRTRKEWDAANRESEKKRLAARYEKQAHSQNEKHACPCGGKYTEINKNRHFLTKKHLAFMKV